MSDDLVKRLTIKAGVMEMGEKIAWGSDTSLMREAADRIEAMTEQLEAARADAKEAEGYAEGLERDLKTCCMAQTVMDNTVAELERERDALKATYDDIYADAMSDAESDARDFESDLWKGIRKLITELGFDWSGDVQYDGVPADEAVSFLREAIGELEEKLRARAAERNHANDVNDAAIEGVNRLKAKLAKAVEALRYYANEENYKGVSLTDPCGCCSSWYEPKIHIDGEDSGHIARATLAEIEGEK
jgi:chromosome segregation ATPase